MIDDECGAISGIRIGGRESEVLGETLSQCHFPTTNPI
jgi:hypothetical protein